MAEIKASREKKKVIGVLVILSIIELCVYITSTSKKATNNQTVYGLSSSNSNSLVKTDNHIASQVTNVEDNGLRAKDAPSHLADSLNSQTTDIHADLRLLDDIFQQYRSAIHGDDPIGDNKDITAVLTGKNKLDFAFIPKSCPAINDKGELCDRWGTPFFFHQLSGTEMQIRSAGEDRKLYTSDDEVLTPGLYPAHL
jgi:hypothetical protein